MMVMRSLKKVKVSILFISFFFFVGIFITFSHMGFDRLKNWKPYSDHYASHKEIIKDTDQQRLLLIEELKSYDLIELAKKFEDIEASKKERLSVYFSKKRRLKEEYSFLGYSSFRFFLYAIGLPILSFIVSFILAFVSFKPSLLSDNKKLFKVLGFSFLYISSFWILHTLFANTEFSGLLYGVSYVLLSIVFVSFLFFLTKLLFKAIRKSEEKIEDIESIVKSSKELIELIKK